MAKLLKLRRGSTSGHNSFTGAEGEVTIDITKDTAVVHDGSTAGGRPLAREDLNNVSSASIAGRLADDAIATSKIAAGALPTDVTVASANIVDGTIVNADINASAAIAQSKLAVSDATTSASGFMSSSDKTKIDGIEAGATADQTNAEIRAAVEAASDSNVFTDADHSKLNGIEASATADQTAAEIRTLVESASDSNVFTDADHTKLNGIEASATADQTASEIVALIDGQTIAPGTIDMEDNEKIKLGAGDDLQIYHDGSNSLIRDLGTGDLLVQGSQLKLQDANGNDYLRAFSSGAVYLHYSNSSKLETTNTGVSVTGALVATDDITAFSDQTLKKDVTTINDALGLCGKLRGVSYKWIKDDKPSIGVIAQEIEQHIPEIVTTTQLDGKDVKSVDYGKIVGVLINAVNELKVELDEYKATYEAVVVKTLKNLTPEQFDELTFLIKKEN